MLVPTVTPQRPRHLLNSLSNLKGGSSEPGYEHAQCVVCVIMLEQKNKIGIGLANLFFLALAANPVQECIYKNGKNLKDSKRNGSLV